MFLYGRIQLEHLPSGVFLTERRKTWIYEVPLQYTHNFRNMVNNATAPLFLEDIKKYDLPVLASAVKVSTCILPSCEGLSV